MIVLRALLRARLLAQHVYNAVHFQNTTPTAAMTALY
jgi:hypothetical protein